ncbi:hypothetical protein [Pedobacter soli]|uniref:HTH cro/C1-type domain-containing protein n=1 Tax=Pedobacter soli TaxID=390242 RepID=A0A1G7AXQ1_9SPHI|nr:hypothetical protein [Pedobacter soli]SDE19674.1 hypothetical protein SAMN04488024_11395 [Pedobacter soli]
MSVHIGLMIWKEMKISGISVSTFAEKMAISKNKAQDIINSSSLDVSLLATVSEILGYNFFSYYEKGKLFSDLSQKETQASAEEIKRLKSLLSEKNKTIELKDKMIQNLSHTVSLLEKVQYR